jgi:tRNA threonylcarbamoyl adenosine modification protein (Sua5/YciO/YrdC/YwlC family)
VPRRLSHPSRKTIGLRVPENAIAHALLAELGQPVLGTTLIIDGELLNDPDDIAERLSKQVDMIIDGGSCSMEPTTVVDLTGPDPVLIREGRGSPAAFGL